MDYVADTTLGRGASVRRLHLTATLPRISLLGFTCIDWSGKGGGGSTNGISCFSCANLWHFFRITSQRWTPTTQGRGASVRRLHLTATLPRIPLLGFTCTDESDNWLLCS
jgi:hypothetical protein